MTRLFLLACLLVCLTGCLTFPSPQGTTSFQPYVGDRRTVGMGSMQVPIDVKDATGRFQNLNITFAALINTESFALISDTADVWKIVYRSRERVFASAMDVACGARVETGDNLDKLRKGVTVAAQEAFDGVFAKWSDAEKYRVEIVIVSMSIGSTDTNAHRFSYP